MNRMPLFVACALAWTVSACDPAVSVRPLYSADECRVDARVEGEWISPDHEQAIKETPPPDDRWTVTRRADRYDVEVRTDRDREGVFHMVTRYDACLVSLDAGLFFDAEFVEVVGGSVGRNDLPTGTVPVHVIGRVLVEGDFIILGFLESHWVEANMPEAFREVVRLRPGNLAVITGLQSELRQFVSEHADNRDAFGLTRYLCRPDADCWAQIYDFELRHVPPGTPMAALQDLLQEAAAHHLEAGHYERAVELLRRSTALDPDDAALRTRTGTALLLAGDYEGARHEFLRARHIRPGDVEAVAGIAWSHFLEHRFEQAAEAFQAVAESPARTSVEPALMAYVALKRAGQTERADALLAHELRTFSGVIDDHLLLLLAANRLDQTPSELASRAEDKGRAHFFIAELLLAEGNPDAARRDLWECLTQAGRDRIYAAAARIELERMSTLRTWARD
jgi:tetratricopeptide (TPR) repeat protein